MINKFSKIVAYGCSFTAGDELLDSEILYRIGDEDTIDKLKREYTNLRILEFRDDYFNKKYVDDKWIKNGQIDWGRKVREERNLSWVRHLSDIYKVPYKNEGLGGASLEYCIFRYEEDLINGKINDDDLIIFCVPSPLRFFYIDHTGELHRCLFNYPACWPDREFYHSATKHLGNTEYNYWNYYKNIKYIEFLKNTRGNVLAFFSNLPQDDIKSHYINNIDGSSVDKMVDEIVNFSCLLPSQINFFPLPGEVTHGFGHNKIYRHKEIANDIATYIDGEMR